MEEKATVFSDQKRKPHWISHEDKTSVFVKGDKKKTFPVTHVNVRISIVFLITKLLILDIIATFTALLFFGALSLPLFSQETRMFIFSYNIGYFLILAAIKIILTLYIVLQWINEYYEITPERIVYRRGIIWRKVDEYDFVHIRSLGIEQGLFGRVFNFGSLRVFDRGVYKYYYLNYLHNPLLYFDLLRQLLPEADIEKEVVREHVRDVEAE